MRGASFSGSPSLVVGKFLGLAKILLRPADPYVRLGIIGGLHSFGVKKASGIFLSGGLPALQRGGT